MIVDESVPGAGRVVELLRDVDPPSDPVDRLASVRSRARRDDQRRLSWVGAGLAVVLVAGVAGAFTVNRSSDAIRLVDVATATEEAGSYRVVVEVTFDAVGELRGLGGAAAGGATLVVRADVDVVNDRSVSRTEYRGPEGASSGSALAALSSGSQETRQIGKDVWTKSSAGAVFAGLPSSADVPVISKLRERPWLHTTRVDGQPDSFTASFDPRSLLKGLATGTRVRDLPGGTVGGDAVDRFVVLVDERSFALAQGQPSTGQSSKPLEVTAAVDSRGRLRQLAATADGDGAGDAARDGRTAAAAMVLTFTDFGLRVDVRPPAADEVQELGELAGPAGPLGDMGGAYTSELEITMDDGTTSRTPGSGAASDPCAFLPLLESQREQAEGSPEQERALDQLLARMTADCAKAAPPK